MFHRRYHFWYHSINLSRIKRAFMSNHINYELFINLIWFFKNIISWGIKINSILKWSHSTIFFEFITLIMIPKYVCFSSESHIFYWKSNKYVRSHSYLYGILLNLHLNAVCSVYQKYSYDKSIPFIIKPCRP